MKPITAVEDLVSVEQGPQPASEPACARVGVAKVRTNYEAGRAAMAAGITGITPAYGFRLNGARARALGFEIACELPDVADWGALGGIVRPPTLGYWKVPRPDRCADESIGALPPIQRALIP